MFNGNELEIGRALRIANLHSKVFPKFKNMYYGRKIAVVGSGPSLNKYIPMKDVVHIGVNNAFKSHVELDFLFMADYARVKNFIAEASSYLPERCVKFYGLYDEDYNYNLYEHKLHIPEALACQANALRYYLNRVDLYPNEKFTGNIETKPLPVFGSVTFNAISFALYTNPKALYLVGLDTDSRGYYDGSKQDIILTTMNDAIKNLRDGYRKLKDYALIHYPKTDIISINPVGLKGLFRDMYINNSGEHIYKDCDISENEWLTIPVAANRFANLESSAPWTKDQFELLAGLIADRLRLRGAAPRRRARRGGGRAPDHTNQRIYS
ncbi:MAG: hypothetical protein LBI57_06170, partial [Helicobacteraceae bacterium]|nr:hypothetical protein [Helicobacteraceae bacterium]